VCVSWNFSCCVEKEGSYCGTASLVTTVTERERIALLPSDRENRPT
jgi:hypothetical protein